MKKEHKTAEQIAEEIIQGRTQPFTAFGKEWQGDVFYSDIHMRTKKSYADYQKVVDILHRRGFYVHS